MYNGNLKYTDGGTNLSSVYPDEFTVTIPNNTAVGTQVCLELNAWPADSHNNFAAASVSGADSGTNPNVANVALREDDYSGTYDERDKSTQAQRACYTVAKKPNFSVEGSNAYSGGDTGISTSITTRKP